MKILTYGNLMNLNFLGETFMVNIYNKKTLHILQMVKNLHKKVDYYIINYKIKRLLFNQIVFTFAMLLCKVETWIQYLQHLNMNIY